MAKFTQEQFNNVIEEVAFRSQQQVEAEGISLVQIQGLADNNSLIKGSTTIETLSFAAGVQVGLKLAEIENGK